MPDRAVFPVRPMDAVVALYSDGDQKLAEEIFAGLSRAVFGGAPGAPASLPQRLLARVSYRALKWTTTHRHVDDLHSDADVASNPILERSGHPYARALLGSSSRDSEALVEGGEPMNGPYMMIVPEIRAIATTWDRIFLNSVQSRDVQLRFIWETRAAYETAKSRLEKGGAIRMKAIAAGTGLSMILVYDRLLKDGYDSARITVSITDWDKANTAMTRRILAKLGLAGEGTAAARSGSGISVETEDIFREMPEKREAGYDLVTAVGILEYLQGFTCGTTERSHRLPHTDDAATGPHLVERLSQMTADSATLIVNTCRPHASTRILELFGKRFDYRNRENLTELLATANFRNPRLIGSGNIYDIVAYEKGAA